MGRRNQLFDHFLVGRRKVLVSDGAEWKKGEDSEGSWIKDTTCRVVAARLRVNRTRVSLSLCVIPFVFESSSKFSYRASRACILVVYSFYSLVGIDRSTDRSKLCLFFLSFFFFFYTEIHSRPKVIDEFNDEWRGKRYPVNSFHHGSNR